MIAYQFGNSRKIILHAEHLSELYVNDYRCIPDKEKVDGTIAVLDADRNARSVSESMTRYFGLHLIDEFKVDYHNLRYKFSNLAEQWSSVCYNRDQIKLPSFNDAQCDIKRATQHVVDSLNTINVEIYDSLKSISNNFAAIDTIYSSYADDDSLMQAVHDKRYDDFLGSDYFKEKKLNFIKAVSSHVNVHGTTLDSYQDYCNSVVSCGNTLFNIYLEGGDVSKYMVEHKNELTTHDVTSYFYSRYVYDELQKRIMRFEYEGECSTRYKGMFKNKAAEELAKTFLKVFYNHIDKLKGNRYAMVMLAFIDMKIIEKGQFGYLFKDFVNREVLKPNGQDLILDNSSINKSLTKVKNSPFKVLTREDLRDSEFTKNEFDRLSDIYWQCISIINLVFEEDLTSKGFAKYLCKAHKSTPNVNIFNDILKLKTILSVLRGKKPLI